MPHDAPHTLKSDMRLFHNSKMYLSFIFESFFLINFDCFRSFHQLPLIFVVTLPLVFVDISRDERDAVCVICNILDSLYVPALMSHARGVCYSLSCLYELKLASVSPRVRSGPSMIMPLIVWRIINDALTVFDDGALAVGHI